MQRDRDLIRALLLEAELVTPAPAGVRLRLPDEDKLKTDYHTMLLVQSGYLDAVETSHLKSNCAEYLVRWLTPAGHDYVDQIRDPQIWQKTKHIADQVKGWSLDTLKDIASGLIKTQVKRLTGVEVSL